MRSGTDLGATKRVDVIRFGYSPGAIFENRDTSSEWTDDPPRFKIMYKRPKVCPRTVHEVSISLKPYFSLPGFGMKSVFWWLADSIFTIMEDEISEHSKSTDGTHFGYVPFSGSVIGDLRNSLHMLPFEIFHA